MTRENVIYTRFSSDMQRDESCEDQERDVRKGLGTKGIDASGFRVMHDRAESGTKNDRAVFDELRGMIDRKEIGILAVDDQSRLSRADNAFSFITDLVYSGGRFISTGEGIDTTQEGWELRVKVMELHNSTTIRELGRRVRRGQLGRVLDDGSAGDFSFGFESYCLDPNWAEESRRGPKPKKGVRICEAQARWVRQIFAWFAVDLKSIGWIARELTRLGVDKGHQATVPGWHHQQVRRILTNRKYVGEWAWGTTRTLRNSDGKTKQVPVPAEQHVIRERPELRIIDQDLWTKAQQRLRELAEKYGAQPGQKRRGPNSHHTEVYPKSLLGGLVYCRTCGSRLWVQGSGARSYLGCPNYRKGLCAMAGRVPIDKAERTLIDFLSGLLLQWPGWLDKALSSLRQALTEAAGTLPDAIQTDRNHLIRLENRIKNLVDQLADGRQDSPAIRQRLAEYEVEAEAVRARIDQSATLLQNTVELPDDAWVRAELANLLPTFREQPDRFAHLLRRLLGRVTAEAVVSQGKQRGYIRLRFRIDALGILQAALDNHLPETVVQVVQRSLHVGSPEVQLDLGRPTRRDVWAPEIAAMRARDMTWVEIGDITGLGTGNAYNVWKRWVDSQPPEPRETG